jgi:hypothetical protein
MLVQLSKSDIGSSRHYWTYWCNASYYAFVTIICRLKQQHLFTTEFVELPIMFPKPYLAGMSFVVVRLLRVLSSSDIVHGLWAHNGIQMRKLVYTCLYRYLLRWSPLLIPHPRKLRRKRCFSVKIGVHPSLKNPVTQKAVRTSGPSD